MSTFPTQPDAPETEELVAYLDGELTADQSHHVERRLASDVDYRRRLTELDQAWSALDALPPTTVDDDFARTTIEMVAVAAEHDVQEKLVTQAASSQRRTYWMVTGGLAITILAFAASRALAPNPNHKLIVDLPVIAQLDVLTEVGDVEYLRGLAKLDFEPTSRDESAASNQTTAVDWQTLDDRRRWIEESAPDKKAELAGKFDRFERLPLETQDHLRKLELDIADAPDRAKLEETLGRFAVWIEHLSSGKRMDLRQEASVAKRLELVQQFVQQSDREARRQLSSEDEKALQDTILNIVEERRGELFQELRQEGNDDLEQRISDHSFAQVALVIIMRDMQNQNDGRRRELQDRLTARLSLEAQEYLDNLEGPRRTWQLWRWMVDALAPKINPQMLEKFFVGQLNNDQREYLLGLPRSEMEEQLQQMYMRSQVGLRVDDLPRRFWRGRPGGRGLPGRDGGPEVRDRHRGPGRDLNHERFDGRPPFPPGPNGPGGPPPGPPPHDGREWRGPRHDGGPPPGGPPRQHRPPPEPPI